MILNIEKRKLMKMLKCEKCGGIIEEGKTFYDIYDKFYCECCVEDNNGIFEVKGTSISVDTTHKFFVKKQARKFKTFDECIRNLENDIFNIEDSLSWTKEQLDRNTKKATKMEVKFWENKVEEKKKFLEEFEKNISKEGVLF